MDFYHEVTSLVDFWMFHTPPKGRTQTRARPKGLTGFAMGVPADKLLLRMQVGTFVQKESDHLHQELGKDFCLKELG